MVNAKPLRRSSTTWALRVAAAGALFATASVAGAQGAQDGWLVEAFQPKEGATQAAVQGSKAPMPIGSATNAAGVNHSILCGKPDNMPVAVCVAVDESTKQSAWIHADTAKALIAKLP